MAEPTRDEIARDYAKALTIIDSLRRERDELLDACRALLAIYDENLGGLGGPGVRDARAAIARADGRS